MTKKEMISDFQKNLDMHNSIALKKE